MSKEFSGFISTEQEAKKSIQNRLDHINLTFPSLLVLSKFPALLPTLLLTNKQVVPNIGIQASPYYNTQSQVVKGIP